MATPDVQMNFAVANILRIRGYSEAAVRLALSARTAVDAFERGRLDRATAQKRLDAVVNKPWLPFIYMDRTFADPDKSGWAKEIRHDPLASIRSIAARTLILYGARDPWVPVALLRVGPLELHRGGGERSRPCDDDERSASAADRSCFLPRTSARLARIFRPIGGMATGERHRRPALASGPAADEAPGIAGIGPCNPVRLIPGARGTAATRRRG